MTLEQFAHDVVEFVRAHEGWELPIVAALAFGESLAVISLFLPATVALVGIGALIGASNISFVPVWLAASVGASLGDWLSYWFGVRFKESVARIWPLSHYPDLIPKGEAFVRRWGVGAVFIGRFFGPARAAVPLAAGILVMPYWPFQLANVSSAFLWAFVLLAPGTVALRWLTGA
jgi:membrane protein DedA with SNARE-associated domain